MMPRKSKGSDTPFSRAIDLLSRRDHSSAELVTKLKRRGFEQPAIDEVLQRLVAAGLVDDDRFASRWVENALDSGRGFGPKLLADLMQRGISRDAAQKAVAEGAMHKSEEQSLSEVAGRRFPGFDSRSASQKERQRVYGYLQRRGFRLSTIISYFNKSITEY